MIQVSPQIALTLALAFLGCVFAFGKILLGQFERRMAERFKAQDELRDAKHLAIQEQLRQDGIRLSTLTQRVELLANALPLEYVRREDWIRFSAAIDHKLDRLAELVMQLGEPVHEIDMEKAQREQVRWRILKVLDAGRPLPVSEVMILQVMQDAALHVTPHGLRRELDYLEDRKLVIIAGRQSPVWSGELTHYGVDVVEYTTDCFPGIARPKKWY